MKTFLCLAFSVVGLLIGVAGRSASGNPSAPETLTLVGVNYFAGWWPELPNKWHGHGWHEREPDWRPQHPDRDPLLGIYNDQTTMDREIAAAADHGVDFFAMLWYFPAPDSREEASARRLNRGLDCFLKSPQNTRLRLLIEYCNHQQLAAQTDADWKACLAAWLPALRHASYLRVGGRLVFKVHDAAGFLKQNGGNPARCKNRLDALRHAVRAAGLGEMLIGGGIMSRSTINADSPAVRLFDFTATYMSIPPVEIREAEHPYMQLAEEARAARARHAADPLPWIPYLAAGWNPRPWTHPQADPNHRRFFYFPTRDEWTAELRALRDDFAKYPALGLPLPDQRRQPIFTIYAWNEFGEGGILAPTRGKGSMMLEALGEVFSK